LIIDGSNNSQIAVLIFAWNEADIIEDTIESVREALAPDDMLFIVADNCSDETATLARNAGAYVVVRSNGSANGKGDALSWFVGEYERILIGYSRLIILDADSQIKSDFLDRVKENISEGCEVMQCFVSPQFEDISPIGKLAAISEIHDQHISDNIRTKLGWPVRMRGTGMVIKPNLLFDMDGRLNTIVEDIALSLIFASKGILVKRLDEAVLFDPKPPTAGAAARQRARWFRGQWGAARQYRREIMRVFLKGPAGWSLLSSLFLKPKWLMLSASLLLALSLHPWPWLAIPFWLYFVLGAFYLFVGLCLIPERKLFFRTLFHIPAYVWMWLRGIILSMRPSTWLSVRQQD